jgi:uncharacterized protein (DUF433 family)
MAPTRTAEKPKRTPRNKPPRGRPVPGFPRITIHPARMGGMACVRDYRFTVAQALRLLSGGHTPDEIIKEFPFLEREDFPELLAYASTLAELAEDPLDAE